MHFLRLLPHIVPGLSGLLLLAGLAWRAAPLVDRGGRLMAQWPTEDGYFMLTMGRNIALGRGLSVAGGEMLTNGTQPLTTFIWAFLYWLVGPEREPGVLAAQVVETLISIGTAVGVYFLGRRLARDPVDRTTCGLLAAAIWFASPVVMPHTMNCLETGPYALVVVAIACVVLSSNPFSQVRSWRSTAALGVLLGVSFWVRNDAAFLIAAVCLVELWPALQKREELAPRLARVLTFGSASVLIAAPWLVYNQLYFGHLMPVSGRAESLTGTLGGNLDGIPVVLLEYVGMILPIPQRLSSHPGVIALATLVLVASIAFGLRRRKDWSPEQRLVALLGGLYLFGLVLFYGIFFGAPWFLSRYFLPLSVLWTPWLFSFVVPWAKRLRVEGFGATAALAGATVAVLAMTFVSARQYANGARHPHHQVVEWVRGNVAEHVWVGAVQTGTLGFFHDRTVNLDGKVNIAAYRALVEKREGEYVVHETDIEYLVDWVGMSHWLHKPIIAENFESIVEDEVNNLAVLRRKESAQAAP